MSRRRHRALPKEVVELLDDDPELLRLAGRVTMLAEEAGAQRSRRRALPAVLVPAAVCAAAAVAAVVALSGSGTGFTDRALAAIGTQPVLRAVLVRAVDSDRTVNLATGKETSTRLTLELRLDEPSGRIRLVERRNGERVSDTVVAGERVSGHPATLDPKLVHFLARYRPALRGRHVRLLGSGTVAGRRVRWLALSGSPPGERVAIDATRFLPVEIETGDGTRWGVSGIGSQPDSESAFRARPIKASATVITAAQAARLVAAQALWRVRLTQASAEAQLQQVRGGSSKAHRHPPGVPSGISLRFVTRAGATVLVRAAPRPLPAYGYRNGRTFASDPIPSKGSMQLASAGARWLGQLRRRGWYLSIAGPDPATVIRLAQRLDALP
jgi:hypothetical protein